MRKQKKMYKKRKEYNKTQTKDSMRRQLKTNVN